MEQNLAWAKWLFIASFLTKGTADDEFADAEDP